MVSFVSTTFVKTLTTPKYKPPLYKYTPLLNNKPLCVAFLSMQPRIRNLYTFYFTVFNSGFTILVFIVRIYLKNFLEIQKLESPIEKSPAWYVADDIKKTILINESTEIII